MPESCCMVMMLKNEAENLERALRSVEGLWSRYVICIDDSTTDETEALVRRWMQGREHLGLIQHFTWPKSFAKARNMLLDLALTHFPECHYALSVDGDDVLAPYSREVVQAWLADPAPQFTCINAYVMLDPDPWGIPFIFFPRPLLLRNLPRVRYQFDAHNAIMCGDEEQLLIQNMVVIHKQREKKRAYREQQRIAENLPNLQQQATTNPEDSRALFYAGNTLLDKGDYAEAEATYLAYLQRSTWPDERYQAMIHLAALRYHAQDLAGAQQWVWRAIQEPGQWNRAESYTHLADCALAEGRIGEALHWYSIAGEMPPPVTSLFLQGAIYTYLPHWRLALLFDRLGRPDRALVHAKRAYAWRPSPEIATAVQVLGQLVAERTILERQDPSADLPLATTLQPLPEAELERLLAEIPVPFGGATHAA